MLEHSFIVPGNPIALKRHRSFQRGKFKGTYDPSKNDKWDFLAKSILHKPDIPFDEPLSLDLEFCFSRPKNHYRSGKYSNQLKDSAPTWHTKTPDADNLTKFVCDALNGIFWKDDSVICDIKITKKYSDSPCVKISMKPINQTK